MEVKEKTRYSDAELAEFKEVIFKYRKVSQNDTLYANRYFLDQVHNSDLYVVLRPSAYYKPSLNALLH